MSRVLPSVWTGTLTPPAEVTVSVWCDRHRVLSPFFTAEPGKWQTTRVPYMREPLDAFADPTVGSITVVAASRCAKTEWMNNCLLYSVSNRPLPAIYVQPREPDVREEFGTADDDHPGRIGTMIKDGVPEHIPAGGKWIMGDPLAITLDNCIIYGAWATSQATLVRRTAGLLLFDEMDNCDAAAGSMGRTLTVATERLRTFGYRGKWLAASTPRFEDGSAWKSYQASDRRKYHVPCPHCGAYQVLRFDAIKVPEGMRDPDKIENEQPAWYQCEFCRGVINGTMQGWMVARGVWVPECQTVAEKLPLGEPDIVAAAALQEAGEGVLCGLDTRPFQWFPRLEGPAPTTRNRGYWLNALYSPWLTWSAIFAKFLRCKDDPDEFRVFKNQWLAEPWQQFEESTSAEKLFTKAADGTRPGLVPKAARLMFFIADLQRDHVEYVIRAWGPGEESWLIREGTCETLDEAYQLAFFTPLEHEGYALPMICTTLVIDSGDGERTDEVYEFGQKPGVMVVKGKEFTDYRVKVSPIEKQSRRNKRVIYKLTLYVVNTDIFKSKAHRLANGPKWHLHNETTMDYCNQFTAEGRAYHKVKSRGRTRTMLIWKPKTEKAPNHKLDCEVYGLACAEIHGVSMWPPESPDPAKHEATNPTKTHEVNTRKAAPQYGFVRKPY